MKLKKGSQAAKDFMAKIRAKKGKTKTKISGTKKTTFKPLSKKKAVKKASSHKDKNSHNTYIHVLSGVNMYSELNKMEKDLMYFETMKNFYTRSLKGELKSGVDKKQQRKNLATAKSKIIICKRRIREQKQLIKQLLK